MTGFGKAVPVRRRPACVPAAKSGFAGFRFNPGGVVGQARGNGRTDGLPPDGAVLLAELDQAVVDVEVGQTEVELQFRGPAPAQRAEQNLFVDAIGTVDTCGTDEERVRVVEAG